MEIKDIFSIVIPLALKLTGDRFLVASYVVSRELAVAGIRLNFTDWKSLMLTGSRE